METVFAIGLVLNICMGILCAWVASERGRSGCGWFLLGLFLGVFAFIPLAMLPNESASHVRRSNTQSPQQQKAQHQESRRNRRSGNPARRTVRSPVDEYLAQGQKARNQARREEIEKDRNA